MRLKSKNYIKIVFSQKAPKSTKYEPQIKKENSNLKKAHTFDSLVLMDKNNDTSSFFDILSRIQSNRLDDQRCSFRLVTNANNNEKSKRERERERERSNKIYLILFFQKKHL